MPELPWVQWYPTNWASEPGLRLCGPATRGIWFEALNTMFLMEKGTLNGTVAELAAMLLCTAQELEIATEQLAKWRIAEVKNEQNGNISLTCRRTARYYEIKELRRKAGVYSGNKRGTKQQQTSASASASASAYVSVEMGVQGEEPEWPMAQKWLADWTKNGATYTELETRGAFLALQANGWMWGRNPIVNHRAALERQIQTDRSKQNGTNAKAARPGSDRNAGNANSKRIGQYDGVGKVSRL
jgi:hypothetical protein